MEYDKHIQDMVVGDAVEGAYLMRAVYPKTSSNGKPFLSLTLADRTGTMEAKVWDYSGPIGKAEEGKAVVLQGTVGEFRGERQMRVERIRLADAEDNVKAEDLVPVAPIDADDMYQKVVAILDSMEDPDYRLVCTTMLERHNEAFRRIPAAKSVHHSFLRGLLMHTGNMVKIADFLGKLYSDTVDHDLLVAGTFLHDFAKEIEFTFSELGLVTGYSIKGQLLGHLVMGAKEVAKVAEELKIPEDKSVLLQHLILSHHGEPEYGAAVRPVCAESELLSYIDKIDSRMEIFREVFEEVPAGEFSGRIFALDKKVYHHN